MSAAKTAATAATGSNTADQICARYSVGSVVSAPSELESQNGVLEVTMKFLTVTDSQGLVRYCYVTDSGLEAPTLRVSPGDQLIIHFQNMLAASSANAGDNMAGMKMTLSAEDATTGTSPGCNGTMGTNVTNIHFHGTNVAPVCGQDEVVHTLVQPGQSFDYDVQIPTNEPPGLYWYHPHPHGISEGQVRGPGARAEFVITTPKVGDQAQLVTQYWNTGPDGDYDPARPIANIVSQNGVESSAVHSASAVRRLPGKAVPMKVTRFADLAAATPVAQRNLYFSEVLLDPSNPLSPTTFFITEEGQTPAVFTMDQQPNIVVHSGTVEDWTIENRAQEDHIFHIHQIHFQVLAIDGQAVNDPAIRDTVDIPFWSGNGPYPSVTVRMDFRDPSIVGTFVYHCHILEHEDGGMMGEIQVLPSPGSASTTTATASALSISPNQNITPTASVVDTATTGNPTPTGVVQFQLNGVNVGNPVVLAKGQATTAATVNGNTGVNNLTAFYEGDSTYAESVSPATPITISTFALSSPGATAAVGSAAIANVTVNVANNYTTAISLTCTMPSSMTESACFVDPNSITGTGQVKLTVNTTPAHPQSSKQTGSPGWLAAGGGASLACVVLLGLPRRKWPRRGWRNTAISVLAFLAIAFTAIGCGGSAKIDPGTAKGTYVVVVTGTAGSSSGRSQASVNVPITIQ